MVAPVLKRVLLKLSGEALTGGTGFGIHPKVLDRLAAEVTQIAKLGIQCGIVIGGGNFFRGEALASAGIGRITADHIGMLGTVMNALAMRDALERAAMHARVMSAIPMSGIVEFYDRHQAMRHMQKGRVVIFAAGTGNPLVTTDSAASLRALEIEADLLLKATSVDGIYDKDPSKHKDAKLYASLTFQEALAKELGIMDLAAFCQCRDYHMPVRVFNINKEGALLNIVQGKEEGTLVTQGN